MIETACNVLHLSMKVTVKNVGSSCSSVRNNLKEGRRVVGTGVGVFIRRVRACVCCMCGVWCAV
jgi:hypothetical protein